MHRSRTNHMDIFAAILLLNMLGFVLTSSINFHNNHMTFYECKTDYQTQHLNGKEFRRFKRKFEAINHMSPQCSVLQ